jgi:hypothetical protein
VRVGYLVAGYEASEELESLRFHWGTAYKFTARAGAWEAVRLDSGACLRAQSADDLLLRVRDDYLRAPVPRDLKR